MPDGRATKVEVLADGQQYVVAGTHASGAALEWSPVAPVASELPTMTREQRDALLAALRPELVRLGCTGIEVKVADDESRHAQPARPGTERLVLIPGGDDLALSARRADGYAATMPPGISGQRGHDATFSAL